MADLKKQKGKKELAAVTDGSGEYTALITNPQCHCCTSAFRAQIDSMAARGVSQRAIREELSNVGAEISQASLQRHIAKHLDFSKRATRKVIEYEAKQSIELVNEHAEYLLTNKAALKIIRQKGFEAFMEGKVRITLQDLLMVIDKLDQMDAAESMVAVDEMQREFQALIRTVKQLLPEDRHHEIMETFERELDRSTDTATMMIEYGKDSNEVTEVTVITEDDE